MKIQIDENGYIQNFVTIGDSDVCNIDVNEPDGFSFDLRHYKAWKYDGKTLVFDETRAKEIDTAISKDTIRENRMRRCFPIINRGQFWYDMLTEEQKNEIREWYQKWLDAPETGVEPEDLTFV